MKKKSNIAVIVVVVIAIAVAAYFLFFRKSKASSNVLAETSSEIPEAVQKLSRDFSDGESLRHGGSIYDMYSGEWSMRKG